MMTIVSVAQEAASAAENSDVFFLWGCLLLAAAIVLLVIELFVPSGGLLGILCAVCAIGSVVAFYRYDSTWGLIMGIAYVVLAPILIVFLFKVWINSPIARTMILGGRDESAAAEGEDEGIAAERRRLEKLELLRALIGVEGVTETALRPVGTVRINGQRIDALAESGIIESGVPVIVTDVYDNQVKVRPR